MGRDTIPQEGPLILGVKAHAGKICRPAVGVIAGIVDALKIGGQINVLPRIPAVVDFNDVFGLVAQAAVTDEERNATENSQ